MKTSIIKRTVLLVDDERNLVRVLEARLRREGFSTISASDGAEALTMLRRAPIDVVVLDVQMSGLTGHETLKAIRAIYPEMPVVLMSAYGKPEELADDVTYLEKPFNLDNLVSAVTNALHVRRAGLMERPAFALFSPGQPVRLVVPDGDSLSYSNGWVLAESEDTLEVSAPTNEGRLLHPPVGSAVRVTLTGRDGLYSFNTRSQGTISDRGNLLLTKPDIIERHQRRRGRRIKIVLPVHLQVVPPDSQGQPVRLPVAWQSVDMSESGMMLTGESSIPANSAVLFAVHIPDKNVAVEGEARVVWDAASANRRRFTMGLQFTHLGGEDLNFLRTYLEKVPAGAAPVS